MNRVKQFFSFCIALLIIGSVSWAFFMPEFFRVHDYTHVARIVEMQKSLSFGQFPPIWTQNFGYGYGMPLFLFYGPLIYFFGSILVSIGFSAVAAMRLMYFFSGVVAFSGMYLLMRRYSHMAGLIAATLLLTAPYRAVDMFVRGALNEVWAIAFLPWLLYGAVSFLDSRKKGAVITAGATAALILTHNLTAFFSIPILGTLGVIWLWAEKITKKPRQLAWKETGLFAASGILGVLMSAFYAVPAFVEKQYTIIDEILSGYFDFRLHFLYIRQLIKPFWGYGGSEPGPNDGMSFQLGIMLLALSLLAAIFLIRSLNQAWNKSSQHKPILLRIVETSTALSARVYLIFATGLLLGLTLFMTLFHSQFIWEAIPLFNFIQFPWRFLGVAIVLASILGGISISLLKITPVRWFAGWTLLLLIVLTNWSYHRPESFLKNANDHYYTDAATIRANMSDILPDYLPLTFDRKLPPVSENERLQINTINQENFTLELSEPHRILWLGSAPEGSIITWNIAHFPGWTYLVNDQEIQPKLLDDGRMQYVSDQPISSAGAVFQPTAIRIWTLIISGVASILWLTLLLPLPTSPSLKKEGFCA